MKSVIKPQHLALSICLLCLSVQGALGAEYIFPHVADGTSPNLAYVTTFLLNNVTDSQNSVTFSFFRGFGSPQGNGTAWTIEIRSQDRSDIGGRLSTFTFVLSGNETVNISTAATDAISTGWVRIRTTAPLDVSEVFTALRPDLTPQKVNWEAGVLASPIAARFSLEANYTPDDTVAGTFVNTGYAIVNPTSSNANITATLYSRLGTRLSQRTIQLPARGQLAEFMDQRFTDIQLPARLHGLISFSSDANIAVTALRLSTAPGGDVFSTVAVNPDFTLGYQPANDQEQNDTASDAQAISLPAEITGFKNAADSATDPDFYSFNLQAGQTVYVVGVADVMGSPVDIDVYLRDSGGSQLRFVVNWASGTTDALFSQQVFTTGKYFLQVVCGSGTNSSGGAYRIFVMAR